MSIPIHCAHTHTKDVIELVPNPRNPNQHPQKQIDLLSRIIKAQGWRAPIVVSKRSGFVVKGHGRLQAAVLLGETVVPVDYQDYENEAAEYADLLADNRIAEMAELDFEGVTGLLRSMDGQIDLELSGFEKHEIENLLAAEWKPAGEEELVNPHDKIAPILLTTDQRVKVMEAVTLLRSQPGKETMTDGEAVAEIAGFYVSDYQTPA